MPLRWKDTLLWALSEGKPQEEIIDHGLIARYGTAGFNLMLFLLSLACTQDRSSCNTWCFGFQTLFCGTLVFLRVSGEGGGGWRVEDGISRKICFEIMVQLFKTKTNKTLETMTLKVSMIRILSLIPIPCDDKWVLLIEDFKSDFSIQAWSSLLVPTSCPLGGRGRKMDHSNESLLRRKYFLLFSYPPSSGGYKESSFPLLKIHINAMIKPGVQRLHTRIFCGP